MLYALSTCGWCKKTKRFLDDNDVEYELTYVDLLKGEEKEQWDWRKDFTSQDIRFTTKGDTLYAIALNWPKDGKLNVRSLTMDRLAVK